MVDEGWIRSIRPFRPTEPAMRPTPDNKLMHTLLYLLLLCIPLPTISSNDCPFIKRRAASPVISSCNSTLGVDHYFSSSHCDPFDIVNFNSYGIMILIDLFVNVLRHLCASDSIHDLWHGRFHTTGFDESLFPRLIRPWFSLLIKILKLTPRSLAQARSHFAASSTAVMRSRSSLISLTLSWWSFSTLVPVVTSLVAQPQSQVLSFLSVSERRRRRLALRSQRPSRLTCATKSSSQRWLLPLSVSTMVLTLLKYEQHILNSNSASEQRQHGTGSSDIRTICDVRDP